MLAFPQFIWEKQNWDILGMEMDFPEYLGWSFKPFFLYLSKNFIFLFWRQTTWLEDGIKHKITAIEFCVCPNNMHSLLA